MTAMTRKLNAMNAVMEKLRDELTLKADPANPAARVELEKLEERWDSFQLLYRPLADEAGKSAEEGIVALNHAAEEIRAGSDRICMLL